MKDDDETDLDLEAAAKRLNSEEGLKKKSKPKSKAKAKAKKLNADVSSETISKPASSLPLSMLEGTSEDKALYESRLSAQKSNLNQAKEYKISVKYKVGDILNHKIFGIGFVVAESGTQRVEVLFSQGRKLLVSGVIPAK